METPRQITEEADIVGNELADFFIQAAQNGQENVAADLIRDVLMRRGVITKICLIQVAEDA